MRGQGAELADCAQPAAEAAVQYGRVGQKHQVACKQGSGFLIEHREIAIAMRGRPRPQRERSCAEIQVERAADKQRWRHDADLVDQLVAHGTAKCIEIELSARGQRTWQVRMADKGRPVLHESGVSENMIGMAMRIDDVADRLAGPGTNSRHQLSSLAQAATRIDHRDRVLANDETDIGNPAVVLTRHLRGLAGVHEHAIRNGANRQRLLLRARGCRRASIASAARINAA